MAFTQWTVRRPARAGWRLLSGALALSFCFAGGARAQAQTPAPLVVAVSEGTSGSGSAVGDEQIAAKYKPVTEVMERVLGQRVAVQYVRDFARLEAGMKAAQYDFVLARPSDYPARAVRDYRYQAVAAARPDGQCLLVTRADSPIRTPADLKGKRFILPEKIAYMSKFCMAELRDQGARPDAAHVVFVREQGAIPFSLANNLAQVGGIASYSGAAAQLEKDGLRVVHKSRPQPFLPLIAAPRVPAQSVAQIGAALEALARTEAGQKALAPLGIRGVDPQPRQRLLDLLTWIEPGNAS